MQITEIKIRLIRPIKSKLAGFATVVFDQKLVIRDFAIFEHPHKIYVSMPSKKMPDNSWVEIVFPINGDLEAHIQQEIIRAYEDEKNLPENC